MNDILLYDLLIYICILYFKSRVNVLFPILQTIFSILKICCVIDSKYSVSLIASHKERSILVSPSAHRMLA
jgi:hypothetical protein